MALESQQEIQEECEVSLRVGPDHSLKIETTDSCDQKMLLGGQYLEQEFTGEMMGSPFASIGAIGYDNQIK